jgi:hypothetical protein
LSEFCTDIYVAAKYIYISSLVGVKYVIFFIKI